MKINNSIASYVACKRHIFIKEFCLYSDLSANEVISFHVLFEKSKAQNKSYVANVDKLPLITSVKLQGYKDGRLVSPAYIAQMCLDAVLEEGYTPDSYADKLLLTGMLLTRKDVTDVCDIKFCFPCHWPEDLKDELLSLGSQLVGEIDEKVVSFLEKNEGGQCWHKSQK